MRELAVAIVAARRAGAIIREYLNTRQQPDTKSSPTDLVTAADRLAEAEIRRTILEAFPGHGILGEEEGGPGDAGDHDHLWIVDPLDGTNNFVQMLPIFCVSVAYAVRGEPAAGVVYDPVRDELFSAVHGGGTFLNGEPVAVDPTVRLADATISTRTPLRGEAVENLAAYSRCALRCRGMRNLGSAALELAWVASGRLSGYWEMSLNAWDRAAGALLVTEAGGRVSRPDGSPLPLLERCGVLSSNGRVHQELVALIQKED